MFQMNRSSPRVRTEEPTVVEIQPPTTSPNVDLQLLTERMEYKHYSS